ncbi:hypothetical protein DFH09DRAFT_1137481 [Mycena vulgaris]|nr:hypothetical protein DFH09DRAFT_1137481 [Mycena vulgaris]
MSSFWLWTMYFLVMANTMVPTLAIPVDLFVRYASLPGTMARAQSRHNPHTALLISAFAYFQRTARLISSTPGALQFSSTWWTILRTRTQSTRNTSFARRSVFSSNPSHSVAFGRMSEEVPRQLPAQRPGLLKRP